MREDPFRGDVQALKNERASFRRRVGDWRLFFDVDHDRRVVEILDIRRRTSTTYRRR